MYKILTKEELQSLNEKLIKEKEVFIMEKEKKEAEEEDLCNKILSLPDEIEEVYNNINNIEQDIIAMQDIIIKKSDKNHTHKEMHDQIDIVLSELKNIKSNIKHYDDKPLLQRINTIQEEIKTLKDKVSGIKIPEVDLTGFLKEKDIKNLVDKKDIESLANKDDVYTKEETYNKEEINNKLNNRPSTQTLLGSTNYLGDLLDVKLTDLQDGDVPKRNSTNKRFENGQGGSSGSKLLTLVGQSFTIAYNGSNQVITQTYADGTVTTNTYTGGVVTQAVTVFEDETITANYTYTGGLVTSVTFS